MLESVGQNKVSIASYMYAFVTCTSAVKCFHWTRVPARAAKAKPKSFVSKATIKLCKENCSRQTLIIPKCIKKMDALK